MTDTELRLECLRLAAQQSHGGLDRDAADEIVVAADKFLAFLTADKADDDRNDESPVS